MIWSKNKEILKLISLGKIPALELSTGKDALFVLLIGSSPERTISTSSMQVHYETWALLQWSQDFTLHGVSVGTCEISLCDWWQCKQVSTCLNKINRNLVINVVPRVPSSSCINSWVQMFSYSWSVATKTKSGISTLRASPVAITPMVTHLNQETSLEEEPGVGFIPHLIFVSALL